MTMPTVGLPDEDQAAAIRAQFASILTEDIDTSGVRETEEQPAPVRRGRGRPPGSKNKPKPADFAPKYTDPEKQLPTLAAPPLTTRDQREVAKRLQGILEGITGVASVAKPYFQMTPEEAEAIAVPLSTYLIRQEATSGVAKQILEEYDVAAFAIALAAYVVRVYLDFRVEREATQPKKDKKPSVSDVADSKRDTLRSIGSNVPESSQADEVPVPVSREHVSASEVGWLPSQL